MHIHLELGSTLGSWFCWGGRLELAIGERGRGVEDLSEFAASPSLALETRALIRRESMLNFSSCCDGLGASFPRKDCLWKRPAGGLGRMCEFATFKFGAPPGLKLDKMALRLTGGVTGILELLEFTNGVGSGRILML